MELHAYFAAQATRCRTDADYMALALVAAEISGARGEVPVGAVLVHKDRGFLAVGVNGRESAKNALWHAEMEAIDRGCQVLGGWRLTGCTLYVTLEPCPMCAGAIWNARISRVVYGAKDSRAGAMGSGVTDAYFTVANKDALTRQIAAARQSGRLTEAAVKRTYEAALTAAYTLDASQTAVDAAETALRQALSAAPAVPSVSAPAGTTAAENSAAAPTTTAPSGSFLPAEAALGADPASEPEESSGLTERADTAQPAERSSGGVVVVCAVMGVVLIGTAGMIVYWEYKRRAAGKGTETDA